MNAQARPGFEEVFTVTEYYDGPRQGIANYSEQPHWYDCVFAENDYSNLYRLTPVSQETLRLAMEDWAIWKRWERAFHAGEASPGTHPCLPAERERHVFLESILKERLKTDMERSILKSGAFAAAGPRPVGTPGILVDLIVKWSEPAGGLRSIWAD
jgi:hypothetical protein